MPSMKHFLARFQGRDMFVRHCVEEQSDYYFTRLETMENKFLRSFYNQIICCTVADAYDFFSYLHNRNNVFYQNAKLLTQERGRWVFKLNAAYQTIRFMDKSDFLEDRDPTCLFHVFEYSREEQEDYYGFLAMYVESPARFEVEFSRRASRYLFEKSADNPVMLAFINNFFYNSFNEFMKAYRLYVIA